MRIGYLYFLCTHLCDLGQLVVGGQLVESVCNADPVHKGHDLLGEVVPVVLVRLLLFVGHACLLGQDVGIYPAFFHAYQISF